MTPTLRGGGEKTRLRVHWSYFHVKGDTQRGRWQAGLITSIFQHGAKPHRTLLIEPFRPADAELDPFRLPLHS